MDDIPEASGPIRNENDSPQLTESAPQKSCLTSSTPGSQHPAAMNDVSAPLITADSTGECLSLAQLSGFDINQLIESCDLKSEEITCLMAEERPSSESDDTYGSCVSLSSETKDTLTILMEDAEPTISEIPDIPRLNLDSIQDWKENVSDGSEELSSWKEPLIPEDDDSDLEELDDLKGRFEFRKLDAVMKESFENDLINLKESPEQILEPIPDQTAVSNVSLLDVAIESPLSQTALADESLVDIEVDLATSPTDAATVLRDKNLLGIEIQPVTNQTAVANKDLMDIVFQPIPKQTVVTDKSLLSIKTEVAAVGTNQGSIINAKNVTRAHFELIKDILSMNSLFKEAKNLEIIQTTIENASASQKGLESLDEQLRAEAELDFQKRKVARTIAEIGFPKVSISDGERVARDEHFMEHRRKKIVCSSFTEDNTEDSVTSELTIERDDQLESVKVGEEISEPVHGTDSEEYVDAVSLKDSTSLNNMDENTLENNIATPETNDSTEIDSSSKSLIDQETFKKTLKKRVTFADRKGDPGVEHMAVHQAESPKTEQTHQDVETSLRFLTESYPSHEDDEILSESLVAILDAPTLPRRRRGSPRVRGRAEDPQKLFQELKTLEEDEELDIRSVTPIQSPQRSEPADSTTVYNQTTTDKPNSKFSKFMKSFKKKIFS